MVHADAADERALADGEGEGGEEVCGRGGDGGEVGGGSGAVGEGAVEDTAVDLAGAGEGVYFEGRAVCEVILVGVHG